MKVAIIGLPGSGKSTLLNLLGCLDTPTSGQYLLAGRDVSTYDDDELSEIRSREIGFVFQSYHLLPDFSALENVALPALAGAGVWGWRAARKRAHAEAVRVLELVELADRAHHRPAQLSGGERQRVAIARALTNSPEVLFCDEPTGNLDLETGRRILDLLVALRERSGCTLVVVTHDEAIAAMADRTVHLVDGRIAG